MDNSGKIENLKLIYTMCVKELNAALTNVESYTEKVNERTSFILSELTKSHNTQMYLLAYDQTLSDLMHVSDLVRKFNIKCEMKPLNSYDKYHSKDNNKLDDNDDEDNEKERFMYFKPDLACFEPNYKVDCCITHIKSKAEKLFYIILNDNQKYIKCVKELNNYKRNSAKLLDHHPEEGEIFGVILEDYMFRAVRENDQYSRNERMNSYNAYLLDTGEVIQITSDMKIYYIPYECKKIPSQAILCKLIMVNFEKNINLGKYLDDHLYMKDRLIVLKKEDLILHVNLVGDTNPFRNHSLEVDNTTTEKPTQSDMNYFSSYFRNDNSNRTNLNENNSIPNDINNTFNSPKNINYNNFEDFKTTNKQHQNYYSNNTRTDILKTNYFTGGYDNAELNDNASDNSLCDENPTCIKSNEQEFNFNSFKERIHKLNSTQNCENDDNNHVELSEKNLAILREEPLNTTNALKAVLGYVPKDDKRICRFYNPETKSCFKGSRCRLEHVEKLKDGWTRDEAETVIDIKSKLVFPSVGDTVTLFSTCIVNIEHFYAQYCSNILQFKSAISELVMKMNSSKEKMRYTPLDCLPVPFQLVIAMYKDNLWYRAKVTEMIDDFTFKVFYPDFGDTDIVGIDQLRKWESKFDYLPFQAIRCKIAGIEAKKENYLRNSGIEQLKRMILNRALKARVINIINDDILLVQLFDEDGYNIGERLISMGYSNEKQTKFVCSNVLLPG